VTVTLRLFATAREAAGCATDSFELTDGASVGDLVGLACGRYGDAFSEVLATARIWVNGDEPAGGATTMLAAGDEVAVLPPVSGG
jgi:MoaD family protein